MKSTDIKVPFANNGDRMPFEYSPDVLNKEITWTRGYSYLYELKPHETEKDPYILRRHFNEVLYLITKRLLDFEAWVKSELARLEAWVKSELARLEAYIKSEVEKIKNYVDENTIGSGHWRSKTINAEIGGGMWVYTNGSKKPKAICVALMVNLGANTGFGGSGAQGKAIMNGAIIAQLGGYRTGDKGHGYHAIENIFAIVPPKKNFHVYGDYIYSTIVLTVAEMSV